MGAAQRSPQIPATARSFASQLPASRARSLKRGKCGGQASIYVRAGGHVNSLIDHREASRVTHVKCIFYVFHRPLTTASDSPAGRYSNKQHVCPRSSHRNVRLRKSHETIEFIYTPIILNLNMDPSFWRIITLDRVCCFIPKAKSF